MSENLWACGSCGNSYSKDEGRISKYSQDYASFMCNPCANKKRYKIEITFSTDQKLTNGELYDLQSAIELQIQEPVDYDQNDVGYQTSQITYKIEGIN